MPSTLLSLTVVNDMKHHDCPHLGQSPMAFSVLGFANESFRVSAYSFERALKQRRLRV